MKLHLEDDKTYYELGPEGSEVFNAWLDSIVIATNPEELDPDEQLAYIEDAKNIRRLGMTSIRTYFVKAVKPEYRHLGFTSDANGHGMQFYTPPKNLLPGQYDTSYSIAINDHEETSERYDGAYNMSFRLSDTARERQIVDIARPTREILHPDEYHDAFRYKLEEDSGRLYVAHRCFRTNLSNGSFPFHPFIGKRTVWDTPEKQIGSISRLLGINRPRFLDD